MTLQFFSHIMAIDKYLISQDKKKIGKQGTISLFLGLFQHFGPFLHFYYQI